MALAIMKTKISESNPKENILTTSKTPNSVVVIG